MKDQAKASLAHKVCSTEDDDFEQHVKLTTYGDVGNYLLATYATDDVIAQVKAETTNFNWPEETSAVQYLEVL